MKICIIGTGYVGLPTGACLAECGNTVYCVEKNPNKLAILQDGKSPIYEDGLEHLVKRNLEEGRLLFLHNISDASDVEIYMICVGTPTLSNGQADLTFVEQAIDELAETIYKDCTIIIKSTVPVGTTHAMKSRFMAKANEKGNSFKARFVFNPEFLKQGKAVSDTMSPDRIIIGAEDPDAINQIKWLYAPYNRAEDRLLVMNIESAEMTKYAANAMLALRISFMNEIASICDSYQADIEEVRHGIGTDQRIGPKFLYAGIGYGGSCFPKDVKALVKMAESKGLNPIVLKSIDDRNNQQREYFLKKILLHFENNLNGHVFSIWGLSFKPETDDLREAPALGLIYALVENGAKVRVFDPVALDQFRVWLNEPINDKLSKQNIQLFSDQYPMLQDSSGLILATEWRQFRNPDFSKIKLLMKSPVIFDGRNQYDPKMLTGLGFSYHGIGRRH